MMCVQQQGEPGNVTGRIGKQEMLPALAPAPCLVQAVEDAGLPGSAPQHWSPLRPPTLQLHPPLVSQWLPAFVHSRQQPEKRPAQGVSPRRVSSP